MKPQRYVSDELTHFVGRNLRAEIEDKEDREEALYCLLVDILKAGTLLALGPWTGEDMGRRPGKGTRYVSWDPSADLGEMFTANVVCFCDIPVGDLGIHMSKYSEFGLAFSREFLLQRGANPVLYLATDGLIIGSGRFNGDEYTDGIRHALKYLADRSREEEHDEGGFALHSFLTLQVFPLIKPFRGSLADDDEENYYMEREWRHNGELGFELGDVRRIVLPERFAKRLRDDLPDYYGQVTFALPQQP